MGTICPPDQTRPPIDKVLKTFYHQKPAAHVFGLVAPKMLYPKQTFIALLALISLARGSRHNARNKVLAANAKNLRRDDRYPTPINMDDDRDSWTWKDGNRDYYGTWLYEPNTSWCNCTFDIDLYKGSDDIPDAMFYLVPGK